MNNTNNNFCSSCALGAICVPQGLNKSELEKLENIVDHLPSIRKGDLLFNQGEPFSQLYAVKSGVFKSVVVDAEGNHRIVGFYLPGEILGLDAIYDSVHPSSAYALDSSAVCAIDFNTIADTAGQLPKLHINILKLMSKEVASVHEQMLELSAQAQFATFILNLSNRFAQRGFSATEFNLPMSRVDMGNYLNKAPETISRLLKVLKNDGVIAIERNLLTIIDMNQLKKLAGCPV